MAVPVTIPRLGWTMEEGTFSDWLKQDGAQIAEGDELFTLESDKATEAVQALAAGVLRIVPGGPRPGETVRVGQVIAYLVQPGEEPPFAQTATTPPAASGTAAHPGAVSATQSSQAARGSDLPPANADPVMGAPGPPPAAQPTAAAAPQASAAPAASAEWPPAALPPAGAQPAVAALRDLPGSRSRGQVASSPRARRVARELGIDWRMLAGSGAGGRVIERDVRRAANAVAAAAEPPAARRDQRPAEPLPQPLSPIRRSIADHMLASARATAPVTLSATVDATQLKLVYDQLRAARAADRRSPGYTALLVKLAALVLRRHPAMCCRWVGEDLQPCSQIDINVAVDTEAGLVAPLVPQADQLSLAALADRLWALVRDARSKRLRTSDLALGCFTVSNLGMYAVDAFTPILNYPQVAILGAGRIAQRPAVHEGVLCVRHLMTLSLTFDHRALDGAPAARFLTDLCRAIEQPLAWLLDPCGGRGGEEDVT